MLALSGRECKPEPAGSSGIREPIGSLERLCVGRGSERARLLLVARDPITT
jgi:hypothetical protein